MKLKWKDRKTTIEEKESYKDNRLLRRLQFTNEMRSTNGIVIMSFLSLSS